MTMDKLQIVTRNLPWVIRDPLVAIIGQECFTTLVYNTDLGDRRCIQYSISKLLGLAIVLGGSIVKLPQILKVLNARSARGLSLTSYLLDTVSTAIVVAYNVRNSFPWSTYGENVFLLAQNIVLIGLIVLYSTSSTAPLLLLITSIGLLGTYVLSSPTLLPLPQLSLLLSASIPLTLSSKVPQIAEIQRNRSTGQLSGFLVASQVLGCLARVFTTSTETGDRVLWWGFVLTTIMNGIIALQMWLYWNNSSEEASVKAKASPAVSKEKRRLESVKVSGETTPSKVEQGREIDDTPTKKNTSSPASAKRYVRKLD